MIRNVVRAHHCATGHIGSKRLILEMSRFYQWASEQRAHRYAKYIQKMCPQCQAMEHPHHALDLKLYPTPFPPVLMDSVSVDIFNMPPEKIGDVVYDCFVACIDRMSGWVIAFPLSRKGATAAMVAKEIYHRAWSLFGVPRVVTSDQGPQFAAEWWRTLCGCLGIRQAFAQAYYSQGNGRAEAAGRELQRKLRHLREDCPSLPWVEVLPRAVRQINDSPGESGMSPYEIVTGRSRNLVGVPIPVEREAQNALDFLARQKEVDQEVARIMNDRHEKIAAAINRHRSEPSEFALGDLVWYLRPPSHTADKALPRWVGPCPVLERAGQRSYIIEIRPGIKQPAHRSQIKPFLWRSPEGLAFPLHYFRLTPQEEVGREGEWQVERVLAHRRTRGKWEFLAKWEGFPEAEATWEPIGHFFHRYAAPFVDYLMEKRESGLVVDVLPALSRRPRGT